MLNVITETCHYCSRGRSPLDIIRLPGGGRLCRQCYQRHVEATFALSGLKIHSDGTFTSVAPPPRECSECGASAERIQEQQGNLQLAVHFENGLYRFMCVRCDASYVPKRRDLYGATQFGHEKRL